jgi:hypothetical protein
MLTMIRALWKDLGDADKAVVWNFFSIFERLVGAWKVGLNDYNAEIGIVAAVLSSSSDTSFSSDIHVSCTERVSCCTWEQRIVGIDDQWV